jgi:hypothetical protein
MSISNVPIERERERERERELPLTVEKYMTFPTL